MILEDMQDDPKIMEVDSTDYMRAKEEPATEEFYLQ